MPCRKRKKELSFYLDGEIGRRESRKIEQHLSVCPGCSRRLKILERDREYLRNLFESIEAPGLPPEFEKDFYQRLIPKGKEVNN
ncbi:MAG: zf-HC2 domain-containing protein [bacterium]